MKANLYVTDQTGSALERTIHSVLDDGVENEVLNIYEEIQD